MARTLIQGPKQARRGEVVELRATIAHPMETGLRADARGQLMPRDILTRFVCRYNGATVFSAQLYTAIAANPVLAFSTIATESGTLEFAWEGDRGFAQTERVSIEVT